MDTVEGRILAIETSGTFYMRLIALAMLWAATTVLCITAALCGPLFMGRISLAGVGIQWANDLQAATVGAAALVAVFASYRHLQANRERGGRWLLTTLWQAASMGWKALQVGVVTLLLLLLLPLLLGVWMDWLHLPLMPQSVQQRWALYPYTHWLTGVVLLKLLHMCLLNIPQDGPLDPRVARVR